jgi:uncharacterized membrane protein YbhN (UPF0104 family)
LGVVIRARLKFLLKIVSTVAVLLLLMVSLDVGRLLNAVGNIEPVWFGIGCIGSFLFVAIRILKWVVLTRSNGLYAGSMEITRTMLMALALGIITPGRLGEVVAVAPYAPEARPKAAFAYLYDRVGELCIVLFFSIPAALLFLGSMGILVGIAIAASCVAGITALNSRAWRIKLGTFLGLARIPNLNDALTAAVTAPPAYWLLCTATNFVAYALVVAFILGTQQISDWRVLVILPVVTLSNLISITVGGLGIREGLAAALAPLGSIAPEVAAMAFLLSFFFTRFVPGLVGLAWNIALASRRGGHPDLGNSRGHNKNNDERVLRSGAG